MLYIVVIHYQFKLTPSATTYVHFFIEKPIYDIALAARLLRDHVVFFIPIFTHRSLHHHVRLKNLSTTSKQSYLLIIGATQGL
jgi:hypothetical protein